MKLYRYFIISQMMLAAVIFFSYQSIKNWRFNTQDNQGKEYTLAQNTSLKKLGNDLVQKGIIDSDLKFKLIVKYLADYSKFQKGNYLLEKNSSPQDLIDMFTQGKVNWPVILSITIPEGFTKDQIYKRLAANNIATYKEFKQLEKDNEFISSLKIPSNNLEGYLYPATYNFIKIPSKKDVITHMVATFWKNLDPDYAKKCQEANITVEKAVIFASLIEKETKWDNERAMIAEVIWARLKRGSPLGIDATLIYGIKDYRGDITWKHLRDAKNKYNSRIHKGLPPTAIGSPEKKSLDAVLNPTNKGYYYYTLSADKKSHKFSKTLSEHNKFVRDYLKANK